MGIEDKDHKYFANRGVERNKNPLKNIIYKIEISQLKPDVDSTQYEQYKFKELGYICLYWSHEGDDLNFSHGFITPDDLKQRIGEKQWSKFCQGKREFIIQRRIDGKNIKKNK